MLKKIFLIVFVSGFILAQSPAKKWVIIQDLQDRIVYLDTSVVKEYDNQLSVWGLTVFRKPQRVTPFQEEVYQIKSNLLFNTVTNTYSLIGTLYYNRSGKIIGESAAPRITGGEDNFEFPIQPGSSIETLYQKAFTYNQTGTLEVTESEYLASTDFSKENPINKKNDEKTKEDTTTNTDAPVVISTEQNISLIDEANAKTIAKQDSIAKADSMRRAENPLLKKESIDKTATTKPNPPSNKANLSDVKLDTKTKTTKPKPVNYDVSKDQNVRGNIWSDGTKYVIQLSSWRRENVADEIVMKQKEAGHKAFKMKVQLPGRGTWYRVRIGYFDTLEEAQNYQRQNSL